MAFQFDSGIFSVEGLSGEVLPGTLLNWYASGSSTPLATYRDADLTTANPANIYTTADGRIPAIWLQDLSYKLIVTLPDGRTITRDPIRNPASAANQAIADLQNPAIGASLVAFRQTGTGAANQTIQLKAQQYVSPTDYSGADDTAKFNAAITARNVVLLPSGSAFTIKDVVFSNSQGIQGNGASLSAAAGATNLAVLADYNSHLLNAYLSNTQPASGAAIRIKQSRFVRVSGVIAPNATNGFLDFRPDDTAAGSASYGNVSDCRAETVRGTAIKITSSVNDFTFANVSVFGETSTGSGGYKPRAGSIGWDQNTPVVSGRAVGGHFSTNLLIINFDRGMRITDAQLTKHSNLAIDNCSDWGLEVLGATQNVDFADLFVGTTRGIRVAGTASVSIDGLRTIFNGLVPPGGASDFFNGTPWDMLIEDTARVTVSGGWRGAKKISVAATAKLVVDCGEKFRGRTGNVSAGSTNYIFETGITPTEDDAIWRVPAAGAVVGITVSPIAAPGAGQSFTYTLRKNLADTSLVANVAGDAAFGGDFWSPTGVQFASGDRVALKLVTSAGAAVTRHQIIIHFIPD